MSTKRNTEKTRTYIRSSRPSAAKQNPAQRTTKSKVTKPKPTRTHLSPYIVPLPSAPRSSPCGPRARGDAPTSLATCHLLHAESGAEGNSKNTIVKWRAGFSSKLIQESDNAYYYDYPSWHSQEAGVTKLESMAPTLRIMFCGPRNTYAFITQ